MGEGEEQQLELLPPPERAKVVARTTPPPVEKKAVPRAEVDRFVLERAATTEHTGRLVPLRRVVSAEPVLTPDVAALTEAVAMRYAGSRSDVLRLAVPPRHATVEKE